MKAGYEKINSAEINLKRTKEKFLFRYGWSNSSVHPGGIWLWSKTIDGVRYTTSTDTAIAIELASK